MTYRGQVKNGQIVLEGDARLGEGTLVEVKALGQTPVALRGSPAAILASRARWVGSEDEAEKLLEELRREKWAEVEAERRDQSDLLDGQ